MHTRRSVLMLLRLQTMARLRRGYERLRSPRRLLLTIMAICLAIFWLGNVALGIIFREPIGLDALNDWLALGLPAYALYHLVKLSHTRPDAGIAWTPAEQAMLCAKPFGRSDLVSYRILTIISSALLKAGLFTVLMFPDLPQPMAGLVGMFLALLFLDLMRMSCEIVAWGVSKRMYLLLRVSVFLVAATACLSAVVLALSRSESIAAGPAGGMLLLKQTVLAFVDLSETFLGQLAQSPFIVFVHVMLAASIDFEFVGWLTVACGLVIAAAYMTLGVDQRVNSIVVQREKLSYARIRTGAERRLSVSRIRLQRMPKWRGAGAILWRQMKSAKAHAGGLTFALGLPAGLSCLPWLMQADPTITLWNVTGALAFYSFLLLPAALKFDFQIDLDRMALMKSLPAKPLAVVLGQLATPVIIASALQLVVLMATVVTQGSSLILGLAIWVMLVTWNVVIFGLDNLVFLLFPHRIKQEGLLIFLRSTLVFTAKGLLFGGALLLVLAWAVVAAILANRYGLPVDLTFVAGAWLIVVGSAILLIRLAVSAFERFDPSVDVPS